MLNKIKALLGLTDTSKDIILEQFIAMYSKALELKLGGEVSADLEFILIEVVVKRYRKMGSEGLTSEGIKDVSLSYEEDLFEPFEVFIEEYKNQQGTKRARGSVKFL